MINLLKFEFRKLFRQKSFYVCGAVMLAMSLIGLMISKALAQNEQLEIAMPTAMSSLLTAVSSSNFTMVSGIFVALFVCADYDQQTIKNVYARGFSRNTVYFAKLVASVVAVLVMFAATLLFTYAVGGAMFDGTAESGNYAALIAGQLLYCIAYAAFVFAVGIAVKRVGVSIALAILGPSLIGTALSLVDAVLKIDGFKMSSYWLDGFLNDLSSLSTASSRLAVCVVLTAVYAAAFVAVGCFINKRQEN
ncbi:MAG: ABC transporter permease [Roseburia sp.]|nr:ABC transporter permease [Roseburia sp.]